MEIKTLVKAVEDMFSHEGNYDRLQFTANKTGAEATKYVYLATLQNFLPCMELFNSTF